MSIILFLLIDIFSQNGAMNNRRMILTKHLAEKLLINLAFLKLLTITYLLLDS